MKQPLPVESLNHIALTTRKTAESVAFYRDVLGFREVARPNFDFDGAWLYGHGLMIHILHNEQGGGPPGAEIQRRQNHISLRSTDLATVERLLQEQGIAYRKGQIPDNGPRQIFFRDPDGHYIEVGDYAPLPHEGGAELHSP